MGTMGASVRVLGLDMDGFDSLEWAQLARRVARDIVVRTYDVTDKQADNMLLILARRINDDAMLQIGLQGDDGQWPDDARLDEIAAALQAVKTLENLDNKQCLSREQAGMNPAPDIASLLLYGHDGGKPLDAERVA